MCLLPTQSICHESQMLTGDKNRQGVIAYNRSLRDVAVEELQVSVQPYKSGRHRQREEGRERERESKQARERERSADVRVAPSLVALAVLWP